MNCLETEASFEPGEGNSGYGLDGEIEITIAPNSPETYQKRKAGDENIYEFSTESKKYKRSKKLSSAVNTDINDGNYFLSVSDHDFTGNFEKSRKEQQVYVISDEKSNHEKNDLTLCSIKVRDKDDASVEISLNNDISLAAPSVNFPNKGTDKNDTVSTENSYTRCEYTSDPENSDPVRTTWVTTKVGKVQMRNDGHTWRMGKWTQDEINLLKSNIDKYCKEHEIKDARQIIYAASKVQRPNFYPSITVGLNRPVFAVYRRVKRMFDEQNYRGKYSDDEVKKLKRLYKEHGRDWVPIGQKMGRSADSVKDRCRLFANNTCGKWSEEEEERLARAVYSVTGEKIGTSVTTNITWFDVSAKVKTRNERQCRTKWLNYLNWKMCKGESWTKTEDAILIQRIALLGVEGEDEIDWRKLSQGWKSSRSPQWLRVKWWYLKQLYLNVNPDVSKITLVQLLKELNKIVLKQINPWTQVDFMQKIISPSASKLSNNETEEQPNSSSLLPNKKDVNKPNEPVYLMYVENKNDNTPVESPVTNSDYSTEQSTDIQSRIVFDKDSNGNYVMSQEVSSNVFIDSSVPNNEQSQIGDEYLAKEQPEEISNSEIENDDANGQLQLTPTSTPLVYLVQNSDAENPLMFVLSDDVNNVDFTPEMLSYRYINQASRSDVVTSSHGDVTNVLDDHSIVVSSESDITSSRHDVITTSDVLVYQDTSNDEETKNLILDTSNIHDVGDDHDDESCFIQSSSPLQGTLLEGTDLLH